MPPKDRDVLATAFGTCRLDRPEAQPNLLTLPLMRGNPILRALFLVIAMSFTSVLVIVVLGNARQPLPDSPEPDEPAPPSALIPTLLTVKLSSPAESLQFVEPSGRVIEIPVEGLIIEHEAELAIIDHLWNPTLNIVWVSPQEHKFLRLDLEPDHLPSASYHYDSSHQDEARPIEVNFAPPSRNPHH